MNENKSQLIKQAMAKIDSAKIDSYLQEHPKSKTLRRIIRYSQRIQASNNDQEIFRLGTDLAYYLNTICDPDKAGYVKDEKEKKYWLEISKVLFKNTIGLKEEKIKKVGQGNNT
jgi:hypothetical protein